jgi:hypothetical protein
MADDTIYDDPSEVDADQGAVHIRGPDAVDVRMTPRAAEETSDRLLEGSMKARGQTYFDDDGVNDSTPEVPDSDENE